MSTLRNHVQLIGRLGADAVIKSTSKGRPYAQLRLATNEFVKTSSGWKDNTQWHTLVVWGELTKVLEHSGRKGSQLLVQGTLQYREYVDSQQIPRTVAEIKVDKIMPFQNLVTDSETEKVSSENEETVDLPI